MRALLLASALAFTAISTTSLAANVPSLSYTIVDTGVTQFYNDHTESNAIKVGQAFYGQDANYRLHPASYIKNSDGTVTDQVTGLMWEADMGEKMTLEEAQKKAATSNLGGHKDWRVPTLKELYSLINFSGQVQGVKAIKPFIDTAYFTQPVGDTSKGEREIDAQTWSSTVYTGKTMRNDETISGVNFVDGRIKGYPKFDPRTKAAKKMYFRLVRGNSAYGINQFVDNKDGTVSDLATGLMWQKTDSQKGMDWQAALAYSENLTLANYDDWRLPSAKELQSIIDYTRSPQATNSAAIDPVFSISTFTDARGVQDYPYFWTATTLLDGRNPGDQGVYMVFGTALGKMNGNFVDAHGAGAARSDPKSGNASDYPSYFGPQGDARYVYNYVRSVRTIK